VPEPVNRAGPAARAKAEWCGLTHSRTMSAAGERRHPSFAALPHYSALTLWTVQVVGMFPTPAGDETVTPFMNHIAMLPLV
jgi:hypothetical protein